MTERSFEVDVADRKRAQEIVRFVGHFMEDLSVEGRFVLAVEMLRLFKPEFDELKRRAASGGSGHG